MPETHIIVLSDGRQVEIPDDAWQVYRHAGRMVGKCLDLVEATFVAGEQTLTDHQIGKFKQLLQNNMYEYRNFIMRTVFRLSPQEPQTKERDS
jgi:hypothetical protein